MGLTMQITILVSMGLYFIILGTKLDTIERKIDKLMKERMDKPEPIDKLRR